ncbi:MAG: hypothetical protein HOJ35_02815 [Bdellovibrionales bacterium]|jgi:hypothetical protein|nr:hypothetical protein [Bdellovibrionales bacterium]
MKKHHIIIILLLSLIINVAFSQSEEVLDGESDLNVGGDIFSDFNEDIVGVHMAEDERYYRYGRFFSFSVGVGLTTFNGNRGIAYINEPPSFILNMNYFMDFFTSFGIGFEFSKHHFFIDDVVNAYRINAPGLIRVNAFRIFFNYRYYIETSNLGTAITYSNPYVTGRMEYWYLTNKFEDQSDLDNDSGGGLGFGLGGGLEFPIKLKESYIGVEILYHTVNFHDKYTQDYRAIEEGGFGFDDLTGNVFTTMVSYVLSW